MYCLGEICGSHQHLIIPNPYEQRRVNKSDCDTWLMWCSISDSVWSFSKTARFRSNLPLLVDRNEPFKKKNHPSKPCRFAIERGGSFTIKMAIKKPTQPKHPARLQDSIVLNVQKNRHHLRDCDFGFQIFRDLSKKQHTATKETSAAVSLHCEDP